MKRLHILAATTVFLCFMMSTITNAQGNSHRRNDNGRHNYEKRKDRPERQNEHDRYRDKRDYHYSRHHHREGQRDNHRYHSHEHERQYAHDHHREYCHNPVYRAPQVRYVRCLPSRHYTRMYINNEVYYYCDGRFYGYHAGCGYHLVDVRYETVSHLPRHCDVRVVDGRRVYYKDGHCYLPHADGRYRVFNLTVML